MARIMSRATGSCSNFMIRGLGQTDTVLAGDRPPQVTGQPKDLLEGLVQLSHLFRIGTVVHDPRVEIAVACMAKDDEGEIELSNDRRDARHQGRYPGDGNRDILGDIVRTETSRHTPRRFSDSPQLFDLRERRRHLDLQGMVSSKSFRHLGHLKGGLFFRVAVCLDKDHGLGVRKVHPSGFAEDADRVHIEHFQDTGNDSRVDDIEKTSTGVFQVGKRSQPGPDGCRFGNDFERDLRDDAEGSF